MEEGRGRPLLSHLQVSYCFSSAQIYCLINDTFQPTGQVKNHIYRIDFHPSMSYQWVSVPCPETDMQTTHFVKFRNEEHFAFYKSCCEKNNIPLNPAAVPCKHRAAE
jgi:hypothetical protein